MKPFLLTIMLAIIGLSATAQETKINWMTFDEAIEANREQPKKIFIDVYTDWCGWCKRMDQTTFSNAVIARYMNENYYAVKFDAERSDTVQFAGHEFVGTTQPNGRKGSHQLAMALLKGKMSYPSYVIMNEQNKIIQVVSGYQDVKSFEPMLHYFVENAFMTMERTQFMETFQSELPEEKTVQKPKQ